MGDSDTGKLLNSIDPDVSCKLLVGMKKEQLNTVVSKLPQCALFGLLESSSPEKTKRMVESLDSKSLEGMI